MTKDRQIVLMLLLRKMESHREWMKMAREMTKELLDGKYTDLHPHLSSLDWLDAQAVEACSLYKGACKILYDMEED